MQTITIHVTRSNLPEWLGEHEVSVYTSSYDGKVNISGFFGCSIDYNTLDQALSDISRRHGFSYTI